MIDSAIPATSIAFALLLSPPLLAQTVWHVDDDAAAGGNGQTWATALEDLQAALDLVGPGDEIWVAAGRYLPSRRLDPVDRRSATFEIPPDVKIYGGFAGTEASLAQRAGLFEQTLLSGELGAAGNHTDNAYHVVYHQQNPGGNIPSRIDGFTLAHANADGSASQQQRGGGLYVTLTGPGFTAILDVAHCIMRDNRALRGAGIAVDNFGLVTMSRCDFRGNVAADKGGAVFVMTGTLRAYNCRFRRNSAGKGGAVYLHSIGLDGGVPRVYFMSSLFHDNAADRGGVAFIDGNTFTSGRGTWVNCTLDANHAVTSGGAFFAKTGAAIPAHLTIRNSILWNNVAPINPQIFGPAADVTWSDVNGGWPGLGNFSADPQFVSPGLRDYRTMPGSPAHDAGDNAAVLPDLHDLDGDGLLIEPAPFDLDDERRFDDDPAVVDTGSGLTPIVDVGAYER